MNKANRVFVLGGRGLREEDWREAFECYGTITDIWSPKDRNSGRDKGMPKLRLKRLAFFRC